MKNIYIFGVPRSGKSTLANMIFEELGYLIISSDCIRNSFRDIFPELNINPKTAMYNRKFQLYLKEIIHNYEINGKKKYNGIVLEGCDINIEICNELYNDGNNIIIYLGTENITPNEFVKNMRANDTNLDWTKKIDDKQLLEHAKLYIENSKINKKRCKEFGYYFVDTSINREEVLKEILNKIKTII